MAFRRQVVVDARDSDRYGRTVDRALVDSLDVNAEMVRQGHAWVHYQYLRNRSLLAVEDEEGPGVGSGRYRKQSGCCPGSGASGSYQRSLNR